MIFYMMTKVVTDEKMIKEVLESSRLAAVFPSKDKAYEMLHSGRRLTFYLGIDPTGANLHLGHTIPLLLLKNLGKLGHKVILLIGDFTARIGDPSGKESARTALTEKEVKSNMRTYVAQARKILGEAGFAVKYNSQWLKKMALEGIIGLTSRVTVQQMIQRDMFQKRMKEEKPIGLNEFLYPLLQGYDSVAMEVDGEVGGNDQTFNMLVGRDLEKEYLGKEKLVFATRLLVDATGKKISKTEGGFIAVNDSPEDVFGKTMKSISDEMIKTVFELCTEKPQTWIDDQQAKAKAGGNPMDFKKELAHELVRLYHGDKEAERARAEFEKVFSQGQLPENREEIAVKEGEEIAEVLFNNKLSASKGEAKRLIEQGAVQINEEVIKRWDVKIEAKDQGGTLKIGPHRFYKIKI